MGVSLDIDRIDVGVDGVYLRNLVCFDFVCNEYMNYLDVTDFVN